MNCNDVKIQECYYKIVDMKGTIKLFTPLDCSRAEKLNKLIIKNSDFILTNEDKNNFILGNNTSMFFTLDSINYQNIVEDKTIDLTTEIVTDTFYISNDILTYKVIINDKRDKDGTNYEYVNIDLKNNELINFDDLIELKNKESFINFINLYVDDNLEKVLDNYKEYISNGYGDLLYSYQLVFENPNYDIKRLKFKKINVNDFSHFDPGGIVFNVTLVDENFLLDEERKNIEEYKSEVIISYKEMISYIDKKRSIYSSLKPLIKK